jgi:hypothetical protein
MTEKKTMNEVVAELRQESVGALLELFELHVAVGEIALATQTLAAGVRELAAETAALADSPQLASPDRLGNLATFARKVCGTAEAELTAIDQLRQGLATWDIT